MAQDHMFKPQQQFSGQGFASQLGHFGRLFRQHLDANDQVAYQLSFVGVSEGLAITQFPNLADVVQENSGQKQVAIQLGIERQETIGGIE